MKPLSLIALAVALALSSSGATAAAKSPPPSDAALDRVGKVLAERAGDQGIPGAVTAIVADGRVVYTHAVQGGSAVAERTPFVIGSSGKSITALAVMQLVDRGAVSLNDPVTRFVPELDLADERAEARITVGQVLNHTSGISPLAGGELLRSVGQGTMLDAVAELAGSELISAPGAEFHYANANYVLAGLVIERASRQSYARYVERNVFEPLGTECSYTDLEDARDDGLAVGHRYWFGFTFAHGPTFAKALQPAGYIASCALDTGKYLAALLNGGVTETGERLVSRKSLEKLFAPGPEATLGEWADSKKSRYGLGWFIGGPWGERAILHPGNSPDSSSMFVLLPGRGWGVVTLLDAGHEMEVPGNPQAMDLTSRNVVDALLDEPVKEGSLMRFYLVFDLLAIVLLTLAVLGVLRAERARRHDSVPHRLRSGAGVAVRFVAGALLLALPALSLGYSATWLWMPDLTIVMVVLGVLMLAAAAIRLRWWLAGSRGPLVR